MLHAMESPKQETLLGVGVYAIPEAARLTGVRPARLRRWLRGYRYRADDSVRERPALWTPDLPVVDDVWALSFNDLVEVLFVREFVDKLGLNLRTVRVAVQELSSLTQARHPFSRIEVVSDGRHLFAKVLDEDGRPVFLNLNARKQAALYEVILPQIRQQLDYDESGSVRRWHPEPERFGHIVVDPAVAFGHPVIEGTRLQTSVLADAYQAEGSYEAVAAWYAVEPALVEQAVGFAARFGS